MADRPGTVTVLATELAKAFEPLEARLAAGEVRVLFAELGLQLPPQLSTLPAFAGAIEDGSAAVAALAPLVQQLAAAVEADDAAAIAATLGRLLDAIARLLDAIDAIGSALNAVADKLPGVSPADVAAFAGQLARALVDFVVVSYLEGYYPRLRSALSLIGVVEISAQNTTSTDPARPPYFRRRLHLDRLPTLLRTPNDFLRAEYGWGNADFDGELLLDRISDLFFTFAVPALHTPGRPGALPSLRVLLFSLRPKPSLTPPGLELAMEVTLANGFVVQFPFFIDGWVIEVAGNGALQAGLAVDVTPPATLTLVPPSGTITGDLWLRLIGEPVAPAPSFLLLGSLGGVRAEAARVSAAVGAGFRWDAGAGRGTGELELEGKVERGRLVVRAGETDGFLAKLLPPEGLSVDFDFTVGWSGSRGVYFRGGAGLDTVIPLHATVGPLTVDALRLVLAATAAGLRLDVGATATVALGPVSAAIDRVGLATELAFRRGNVGPADVGVAFKPPNGVALAVDAGTVTGGGYLSFDHEKEQYSGALQLQITGGVAVSAFGLLTTRLPDGRPGFSLVLLVTAEGFQPIPIGFGFTLTGVGGVVGVNRTADAEVLRAGLRSRTLDTLLFPRDPARNAPQVVSNLNAVFPPAEGRFVFGPVAKLAWGSPTLLTINLALVLELPAPVRLIILGQLKALLPAGVEEERALVRVNMDALGVINFDRGELSLDATLYDSKLVEFTLTGDMALRARWTGEPMFILAVGGFNPRFPVPAGFPRLNRLAVALSSGDALHLRLESYLALTSNTVQLGARLELVAKVLEFTLRGYLGFDALFHFDPFEFVADMAGALALSRDGRILMGAAVEATLTGPSPWHVRGTLTFEILSVRLTAPFEATVGERRTLSPVQAVDVRAKLLEALRDARNWGTQLPEGTAHIVSVRRVSAAAGPLVHPLGELMVHQRVVPLGVEIARYGTAPVAGDRRFELGDVRLNSAPVAAGDLADVRDFFAPGQLFDLSDAEKLARPSFESLPAGVRLGVRAASFCTDGAGPTACVVHTGVAYDTIVIGAEDEPAPPPPAPYEMRAEAHEAQAEAGPAAGAPLRRTGAGRYRTPYRAPIRQREPEYVVASVDTLGAESEAASYTEALEELRARSGAAARRTLQVVGVHELD